MCKNKVYLQLDTLINKCFLFYLGQMGGNKVNNYGKKKENVYQQSAKLLFKHYYQHTTDTSLLNLHNPQVLLSSCSKHLTMSAPPP